MTKGRVYSLTDIRTNLVEYVGKTLKQISLKIRRLKVIKVRKNRRSIQIPTGHPLEVIYAQIKGVDLARREILDLCDLPLLPADRAILDGRLAELSIIEAEYYELIQRLY